MPGAANMRIAQSQCPKYHKQSSSPLHGPARACQRQMTSAQSYQHSTIRGSLADSHRYLNAFSCKAVPCRSMGSLSVQRTARSRHSALLCTASRRHVMRKKWRGHICIVEAMRWQEACSVLGVDDSCSKEELRAAYLSRIKQVHPDVNPALRSTDDAVRLNEAYAVLQLELGGTNRPGMTDIFDYPEADPGELFINPFACAVDPFMWRELQDVARSGRDPAQALAAQGVYIRDSAVYYLTPLQLAAIEAEMRTMEGSMSFEVTAWIVLDCLQRAARANDRMPSPRRR